MTDSRHPIPGSERTAIGTVTGPVPDDEKVSATLVLRRRSGDKHPQPHHPHAKGGPLSSEELGEQFGADPDDLAAVTSHLEGLGVRVVDSHGPSRRVRIEGPAKTLADLFGTQLHRVTRDDGRTQSRMREGGLSLPKELHGVVTAVLGLDDRPQASPRTVFADPKADNAGFTPLDLAKIYGMPDADGTGQTVAIVELGGGFGQDDLDTYFKGLGLTSPKVTAKGVDGAKNVPGKDPNGADGEVLLDIEVVGGIAPKSDIVVYFGPNSDDGFVDAISTAAHATPTPAAISISWGQSEDQWTAQGRKAMDDAIADAVALGVTVTAAAGDSGSGDGETSGAHADFPASSPHALGCGGTSLKATDGKVSSETVWNGGDQGGSTGGGVSDTFDLPDWQKDAGVPKRDGASTTGRGVPDVAGDADPATGYKVLIDGQEAVIGGTSAVAPLWAGLVARLAQLGGKPLGLLQTVIYDGVTAGQAAKGFRDITEGSNGAYDAAAGWDPCTGLGVPNEDIADLFS